MAASQSWQVTPLLAQIKAVMAEVGARNTVLVIYFRHPFVVDEESGMRNAGAMVAGFGVGDSALRDVLSGKVKPHGELPFALANNLEAVRNNDSDAPGYSVADTLFPFAFGLTY
jgi:beta-glucosidase